MKKFFSIVCALAIVLSASAVPQFKTEKMAFSKNQKVEKKVQAKKAVAAKPVLFAGKQKMEAGQVRPQVKKAAKATTNVTVSAAQGNYYASYSAYIYVLVGDNDKYYSFAFPVDSAYDPVVAGQTYTLADMDDYYSYWYDDNWDYADYTACTFTKTVDANNKVKIIASATDTNGDVWNLTYDEATAPQAPAGGSFVADEVEDEYFSSTSDIQYVLTVTDSKLVAYFDILLPADSKDVVSGQTYTQNDMDLEYSGIVFNKATSINIDSASFVKTVAADGSYTIAGYVEDTDGNVWNFSASKAAPSITSQTLTLNGTAEAGTYYSFIEAANADTTQYVGLILYGSSIVGSFTEEDLYASYSDVMLVINDEEVIYGINEAAFTVVYDETLQKYLLNGTLKTANEDNDLDQVIFTLNLTLDGDAPEPPAEGGSQEVAFAMQDMTVSVTDSYWDIKGTDPTTGYFLEIRSLAADLAGTYTEENLDDYWTYVGTGNQTYYDINKANVTVTFENNMLAVKGTMTFILASAKDTIIATINVAGETDGESHLEYDEQNADFIVNFPTYNAYYSYIESDGVVYVQATDASSNTILLEFPAAVGTEALAAAEYEISLSGEIGTVNAGAGVVGGYLAGSYAGIKGTSGIANVWFLVSGKVLVTENGVIEVDALNSYGRAIKCRLGEYPEGIDNTEAEAVATKRIINGQLVIEKNGVRYNAVGTMLK